MTSEPDSSQIGVQLEQAFQWPARLLCKFEDAVPTPPCVRQILEGEEEKDVTLLSR